MLSLPCLVLFLLSMWALTHGSLHSFTKHTVIWQNAFYPELVGAFATFLPCVSLTVKESFMAWDLDHECPSAFPPLWAAGLSGGGLLFCVLTGPLFWWWLISRWSVDVEEEERTRVIGFLAAGYKPEAKWWEVVVLSRRMAWGFVGSKVPVSFAPVRFVVSFMLITQTAQLLQSKHHPYINDHLNKLEDRVLQVSMLTLICMTLCLSPWYGEPLGWFVLFALTVTVLLMGTLSFLLFKVGGAFIRKFNFVGRVSTLIATRGGETCEDDSDWQSLFESATTDTTEASDSS
mmetsp:Transcript_164045/g.521636  ORF Transcript_164045/g.521636 Transcript_164045/m.521636 type:complete len:289 (+) Transcript_164045:1656-2522(+)